MKLDEVLATLRQAEASLRPHGVVHAGVFGSTARGARKPESDIDIALDLDDRISRTLWDYAAVKLAVADLFDEPVDVVDRAALKPYVRENVERELVYAF
jgi:uncharacterized protein